MDFDLSFVFSFRPMSENSKENDGFQEEAGWGCTQAKDPLKGVRLSVVWCTEILQFVCVYDKLGMMRLAEIGAFSRLSEEFLLGTFWIMSLR